MSEVKAESSVTVNWSVGDHIQARDYRGVSETWYSAIVRNVDLENQKILVHYRQFKAKWDHWFDFDSQLVRAKPPVESKVKKYFSAPLKRGDQIYARWSDRRFYPARVIRHNSSTDEYDVIFRDGVKKSISPEAIRVPFPDTGLIHRSTPVKRCVFSPVSPRRVRRSMVLGSPKDAVDSKASKALFQSSYETSNSSTAAQESKPESNELVEPDTSACESPCQLEETKKIVKAASSSRTSSIKRAKTCLQKGSVKSQSSKKPCSPSGLRYFCPLCSKACFRPVKLRQHLELRHPNSGIEVIGRRQLKALKRAGKKVPETQPHVRSRSVDQPNSDSTCKTSASSKLGSKSFDDFFGGFYSPAKKTKQVNVCDSPVDLCPDVDLALEDNSAGFQASIFSLSASKKPRRQQNLVKLSSAKRLHLQRYEAGWFKSSFQQQTRDETLVCPIEDCQKVFRNRGHLDYHFKYYHPDLLSQDSKCNLFRQLAKPTRKGWKAEKVCSTADISASINASSVVKSPSDPFLGERSSSARPFDTRSSASLPELKRNSKKIDDNLIRKPQRGKPKYLKTIQTTSILSEKSVEVADTNVSSAQNSAELKPETEHEKTPPPADTSEKVHTPETSSDNDRSHFDSPRLNGSPRVRLERLNDEELASYVHDDAAQSFSSSSSDPLICSPEKRNPLVVSETTPADHACSTSSFGLPAPAATSSISTPMSTELTQTPNLTGIPVYSIRAGRIVTIPRPEPMRSRLRTKPSSRTSLDDKADLSLVNRPKRSTKRSGMHTHVSETSLPSYPRESPVEDDVFHCTEDACDVSEGLAEAKPVCIGEYHADEQLHDKRGAHDISESESAASVTTMWDALPVVTYNKVMQTDPCSDGELEFEDVVRCVCGDDEEHELMVQCDNCLLWQHATCVGLTGRTAGSRRLYVCFYCKNPPGKRRRLARKHREFVLKNRQQQPHDNSPDFMNTLAELSSILAQTYDLLNDENSTDCSEKYVAEVLDELLTKVTETLEETVDISGYKCDPLKLICELKQLNNAAINRDLSCDSRYTIQRRLNQLIPYVDELLNEFTKQINL